MTITELNHIEKELTKLNCPSDLIAGYAIQLIKDIKEDGKEVLKAFLCMNKDTLMIDYK